LSVGVLVAQIVRGFEVALFRCFQSPGSFLSRNGRDKLSDLRNSGDCCRKNFVFSSVKVIGLLFTMMPRESNSK